MFVSSLSSCSSSTSSCSRYNANFKFDQPVFTIHDSPLHILRSVRMTIHERWAMRPRYLMNFRHRIRYTEGRLLGFSHDFPLILGVTRNSSSNADAMVAASARLRGIHPPDIIQNGGRPGGMPLKRALARTMASAFWWWIMAWQRLLESTFCVPYSVL
jgi:hypothetical protein